MTNLEAYVNMIKSKLPQLGFNVVEGGQIVGLDLILSAMSSKNMKSPIGLPTLMNVQIYIYSIFRPNLSIMDYNNFTEHCFQYFEAIVLTIYWNLNRVSLMNINFQYSRGFVQSIDYHANIKFPIFSSYLYFPGFLLITDWSIKPIVSNGPLYQLILEFLPSNLRE